MFFYDFFVISQEFLSRTIWEPIENHCKPRKINGFSIESCDFLIVSIGMLELEVAKNEENQWIFRHMFTLGPPKLKKHQWDFCISHTIQTPDPPDHQKIRNHKKIKKNINLRKFYGLSMFFF